MSKYKGTVSMGIMFAILKQKNTTVLHLAKIPNVVSNNKKTSLRKNTSQKHVRHLYNVKTRLNSKTKISR